MSYARFVGHHPMNGDEIYKVEIDYFIEEFKKRWIKVEIGRTPYPDPARIVFWETEIDGYTVFGGMHNDQYTIAIEGGSTSTDAQIAVWYRSIVPADHELYFYSGPHIWTPIQITPTTTVEEIVDAWNRMSS